MGTRGTAEDRDRETSSGSEALGLTLRENLGLPDGRVEVSARNREALAARIRAHAPHAILAHHTEDLHPDHAAAGHLAREAWYLAGLKRLAGEGAPAHRPPRILHFPGHVPVDPTFVVDIGPVWQVKQAAVRAYASQLEPQAEGDDGRHFLFGADILARMETKARYWGELAGVRYGEPLLHRGPIPIDDPLLSWFSV